MTPNRERDVTRTFVALASSFANGYDVVDLLSTLTADSARLLDVASAGILLADPAGILHVLAASTENTRHLEVFQLQRQEGPCLDCFRTGQPINVPDLALETDRWPQFVAGANAAGFVSVHAVPMRLRSNPLGTLGLFGQTTGELNPDDLALGQALADVASVALVQDQAATDTAAVNEQLQGALTSRVVIEQAKGILAQSGNLTMDQAFAVLRRYARDHNLRLGAAAETLVSHGVVAKDLIAHAQSKGVLARP